MRLNMDEFDPRILRASVFDGYVYGMNGRYAAREVYDYELEYYTRSAGGIIIDGVPVPFLQGDVNVRKPGQIVQGVPPYRCFIICFDARGNGRRNGEYVFGSQEQAQPRYENPILDSLPDKISCAPGHGLDKLFERVYHAANGKSAADELFARTALMDIISLLYEAASPASRRISPEVRRAAQDISENFAQDISVDDIIERSGMSVTTFRRHFTREIGKTPLEMVTQLRISRARELLLITDYDIGEIGSLCGYMDNAYFTRIFHRECGVTPSEFRKGRRK